MSILAICIMAVMFGRTPVPEVHTVHASYVYNIETNELTESSQDYELIRYRSLNPLGPVYTNWVLKEES